MWQVAAAVGKSSAILSHRLADVLSEGARHDCVDGKRDGKKRVEKGHQPVDVLILG